MPYNLQEKKKMLAEKLYCQYGHEVKGKSSKYSEAGKGGHGSEPKFKMHGAGKGSDPKFVQANAEGGFKAKYHEGGGRKGKGMVVAHSKESQKGKASLESHGKNEGENMMVGKNERNRA